MTKQKYFYLAILCSAIFVIAFIFVKTNKNVMLDPNWIMSRQRIYVRGVIALFKSPIVGYGLENYDLAVKGIDYPVKVAPENEVNVDKPHNQLLEVGLAGGFVALGIWTLIVIMSSYSLFLSGEYLYLSSFFILILRSQTNPLSSVEHLVFWFLVGIGLICSQDSKTGSQHKNPFAKGQR